MGKKKAEFDPVKRIDDTKAQAVVWSTASLNAAVEAIKKGLPLKANPFLNNDIQLLKPDLVFRRTQEEVDDWIRCKEDKVYFANKCYLKTPTGVQKVTMRDYQERYLYMCNDNPMSIFISCRQSGKSTTTAVDAIHELLFSTDKNGLIVSKSGDAGIDLLKKTKDIYRYLPWHLKAGVTIWNVHKIAFDNNSTLWTESPSPTAGLGSSVNYLILDEFAWMPLDEKDLNQMWQNLIPVVTADSNAKIRVMSTQNGFNMFYRLYMAAIKKESAFVPFKVDWWDVPEWNHETKQWEKRTDEWKNMQIKKLGSEEDFNYQYSTQFAVSDNCLISREGLTKIHARETPFRQLTEAESSMLVMTEQQKSYFYISNDITLQDLKTKDCVILVDLAEGGGGDSTVFHLFEKMNVEGTSDVTLKQIGYWRSNKTDLEEAALVFWLMTQTMFTPEHFIASVELNTYGALFENYVIQLNESDYKPEWNWRFSVGTEFDYTCLAGYKKSSQDDNLPGMRQTNAKTIPGIRWNSSNKPAACMMLKGMIEKDIVQLYDIVTIAELEAFEDKTGRGHYKAAYGHDDIIMTCVQIPMLMETAKWKSFVEETSVTAQHNADDSVSFDCLYEDAFRHNWATYIPHGEQAMNRL